MKNSSGYILNLSEIDKSKNALVGGKGANLGELSRIGGIRVPEGFCVSTEAFKNVVKETPVLTGLLNKLSALTLANADAIRALSRDIRNAIESAPMPAGLEKQIVQHLAALGEDRAFAVRSSATAEDLPTASFAGQQDTYLNIIGSSSIVEHITKCWASLFTERAVVYRIQNGFDHRKVYLSVVIQEMVTPRAAGILFTADPVTSNRKVVSIDASYGLGEAMVSGRVSADNYKVADGIILNKTISVKKLAIYGLPAGGTKEESIESSRQTAQTLSDAEILELEIIGRKIERHFGTPQDIEWCLVDNTFYIVQSRPITTLFPLPGSLADSLSQLSPATGNAGGDAGDNKNHVYVSVAHQQMMTDAIKPLGLSVWLRTAVRPMSTAGGRLFVDISDMLASSAGRAALNGTLGKSDPLTKDALNIILERENFITMLPDEEMKSVGDIREKDTPMRNFDARIEYDPAIVPGLILRSESSLKELKNKISQKAGLDLVDFIMDDILQFSKFLTEPQSFTVIMTSMNALSWINEKMMEWLGEKNAGDIISQSVPNNITSEMGLELLNVADVIRPYPEIINYLQKVKDDNFLEELLWFKGGKDVRDAITGFLNKYGMRCAGEIDITRTRWSEKPATILPTILGNIKNVEPGAGKLKFQQGLDQALKKEDELLTRLKQLPGGEEKAKQTKEMIRLVRNYAGYREYPKYGIVSRYFVYKQALMKEAVQLVQTGVLRDVHDIYYLTLEEVREVVRTGTLDYQVISIRKEQWRYYEKINPPRVVTSEGEIITGKYKRENIPAGAIIGLPVSSGIVEGRARVILKMEDADLEDGDILVTAFTDPSWTPLFVSIKGLVTEVGGLMTHGAVIAREYGLPAVVGLENATKLIRDGQRIRVNGTDGYIEILSS
jgi:pyruvate,water dikinase